MLCVLKGLHKRACCLITNLSAISYQRVMSSTLSTWNLLQFCSTHAIAQPFRYNNVVNKRQQTFHTSMKLFRIRHLAKDTPSPVTTISHLSIIPCNSPYAYLWTKLDKRGQKSVKQSFSTNKAANSSRRAFVVWIGDGRESLIVKMMTSWIEFLCVYFWNKFNSKQRRHLPPQ